MSGRIQTTPELAADLARCRALARSHYENFAIGSRLLPRPTRRWLAAIYAVVRIADDVADEGVGAAVSGADNAAAFAGGGASGEAARLAALEAWERGLESAAAGEGAPHWALRAGGAAARALDLPLDPFRALFRAFRRDLVQSRYASYEELLGYCRDSANPVGELVLRLFGAWEPRLAVASDAICTGLQLVNHWQDVGEDARRGRIYLPLEDLARFGVTPEQVLEGRDSQALRSCLAFENARARALLEAGGELVAATRGRLRLEVALFRRGGLAASAALTAADHAVLQRPPRLGRRARVGVAWGALRDAWLAPRPAALPEVARGA